MNKRPRPRTIRPEDAEKGAAAELAFKQWLTNSELASVDIVQTPFSMPAHLRGKYKRPDYLVGVPPIGIVAFEVKAKTIFDGCLIFDLDEVKRLRTFTRLFPVPVYFACLDPAGGDRGFWVRLDQLDFVRSSTHGGKATIAFPVDDAMPVSMHYNFIHAFCDAVLSFKE